MNPERHVKIFKNGRNQAVRIPGEFELPGEDAIMRKEGDRLIIEPAPPKSLLAVLAPLAPLEEDFYPLIRSISDVLLAGHEHRLRSRPQPAGGSGAEYPQGRRSASLHQHHRRG
jgi:antitoxin VapB